MLPKRIDVASASSRDYPITIDLAGRLGRFRLAFRARGARSYLSPNFEYRCVMPYGAALRIYLAKGLPHEYGCREMV